MRHALTSPFVVGVACRIGAQVSAFSLILLASRALDLSAFGAYAIASALCVIFTTLVYTGLYHILLRSPDIDRDRDTFFVLQLGVGLCGSGVMIATALALGSPDPGSTAYALLGLAPVPSLAALGAWLESQLVREGRIRTTSAAVLASEVTGLLAAIALFRADYGVEALIASRLAPMLFIISLYLVLLRRWPGLDLHRATARHAIGEAWPLWGSVSLAMLSNYGADLVLGAFLTPSSVGAYRAGARVANTAADVVIQPLGTISWARFARLETTEGPARIHEALKQNMALGVALVLPTMISLSLLAPALVAVLLDPSWGAAAGVVGLLALARATNAVTFLVEPALTCLGRGRLQFYLRIGDATLLLLLLVTLGRAGAEQAALAILIKDLVLMSAALLLLRAVARLTLADLARATAPGLGLSAACLVVLLGAAQLPADLAPMASLALTTAALVLIWGTAVAGLVRRRVLVLPKP